MEQNLFTVDINNLRLTCFEKLSYPKGYVFNAHYHMRIEVMYVVSGKIDFDVFKESKKIKESLTKNQFILFDSGTPHGFTICEENTYFWTIEFEQTTAEFKNPALYFSLSAMLQECPTFAARMKKNGYAVYYDQCDLEKAFSRLTNAYAASSFFPKESDEIKYRENDYLFRIYLNEIFVLMSLNASLSRPTGTQYISRINAFLTKNFATDFSLDDLAATIGINKHYMERLYKQYTGNNIHEKILLLRCEKAKKLLSDTNEPIGKIAQNTGFGVRQQLIYNFKKIYGITPTEYRNAHQNESKTLLADQIVCSKTYDFVVESHEP